MSTPDWFHAMEDELYGVGDTLMAAARQDSAREVWHPERVAHGAYYAERAGQVAWRESERVLSLQRLMGG